MFGFDNQKLRGPQKAAAFLLSLDEEYVAKIFEFLDSSELRDLTREMTHLGKVNSEDMENIYHSFITSITSGAGAIVGSIEKTRQLLSHVFPEAKVRNIMDDILGPEGRTLWEKLENIEEDFLLGFLKLERPQTVAVILSRLSADKTSSILTKLDEDVAKEILIRILKMDTVSKEIITEVERTLNVQFINTISKSNKKDSHQIIAEVFNLLNRENEEKFMKSLEDGYPEDAEKIRDLMFTFDDLANLDSPGIQELLKVIDRSNLALALKGSPERIKDLFLSSMSERAGNLLRDEMDELGRVRLKDVESSQAKIVAQAKELIDQQVITIAPPGSEQDKYVE